MTIFRTIYNIILDALFPISKTESEVLSLTPEQALETLPPAPDYAGLAFDLPHLRSAFAYKDKRVSKLIWLIKEKRSLKATKIAGQALFSILQDTFRSYDLEQLPVIIVPIPITPHRRRQRGYNQCELLVDEIEKLQQEKIGVRRYICEKNLIFRNHDGIEQKLKNRAERVAVIRKIFSINKELADRYGSRHPIVIIDDVITTGSTMHEAIQTLATAGCENVRGLSVAH